MVVQNNEKDFRKMGFGVALYAYIAGGGGGGGRWGGGGGGGGGGGISTLERI